MLLLAETPLLETTAGQHRLPASERFVNLPRDACLTLTLPFRAAVRLLGGSVRSIAKVCLLDRRVHAILGRQLLAPPNGPSSTDKAGGCLLSPECGLSVASEMAVLPPGVAGTIAPCL